MTIEQLRRFHEARPFTPFKLHLADGREVVVEHPEFMLRMPSGRTIEVAKQDDSVEVIDLLLVASIETVNGQSAGRRRGKR